MVVTWLASIAFGWMHQVWWLIVPPIAFIGYAALEVARNDAWAKREMNLTWGQVAMAWMSGASFRGYGRFLFVNPLVGFVLFGITWAASSILSP
jgi:hypothetical protein